MAQQAFFAPDKLKFKAITGTANENLPYKFTYNQRRLTQGLTQLANHPNRDDILRDALRDSLTEDAADQLPAIEASLTAGYTPQELLTAMSAHFQSESYQGSHMQLLTSYPNFQDQSSLKMGDYLNKLLKLAQRAGITTDATLDLHVRSKLGTADSPAYSRWRQTRSENGGTNARVARLIAILQQQDFGSNGTPDLDDASEGEKRKNGNDEDSSADRKRAKNGNGGNGKPDRPAPAYYGDDACPKQGHHVIRDGQMQSRHSKAECKAPNGNGQNTNTKDTQSNQQQNSYCDWCEKPGHTLKQCKAFLNAKAAGKGSHSQIHSVFEH